VRTLHMMGFRNIATEPVCEARWTQQTIITLGEQMTRIAEYVVSVRSQGRPLRITWLDSAMNGYARRQRPSYFCGAGRTTVAVAVNGTIWACHRFTYLYDEQHEWCAGNVHGKIDLSAFEPLTYEWPTRVCIAPCGGCVAQAACSGGCPAVNWEVNGTICKPTAVFCAMKRRAWELGVLVTSDLDRLNRMRKVG